MSRIGPDRQPRDLPTEWDDTGTAPNADAKGNVSSHARPAATRTLGDRPEIRRFSGTVDRSGSVEIVIGLPDSISACLFDLDGVLTSTEVLHRKAWKRTFDDFLRTREGTHFAPFTDADYLSYVDGKPRADGVRSFLSSRGITLPEGGHNDPHGAETVNGLGNRKNNLLLAVIDQEGVSPYPGSVRYLSAVYEAGLKIGVVTSSANGKAVLDAAGLSRYVHVRIDGVVIRDRGLRGKPAPDSYLAAAEALAVSPSGAAVFEDAISGVEAGRAGSFGLVVGVDRVGQASALRTHGADVVVSDLEELMTP
ncbi:haloacid dehalogenase superfamily, subfamily IA, variant 3 with third motif having DD or ED/beta-phosphoglucomutase family hydrolase [Rhodococcus triatomae]|uniref:Beta-phosphoglucomutase n=1 Tax=Rhodococcus triatomae TaxID=300028 RepID=A0A1G8H5V3_9NOCA|nr:haloacid dehalogenase superfamily, subfamily IA, variant 3 with third motif having DD or ED/beta-phosphoglucomutase family hydrolase [Rhodococcus triatomae]